MDEDGWTILEPSEDSRVVYLSQDGDDSNDGLTPGTAKKTLREAVALLRDGYPDHLRLRRGDVFRETFGRWTRRGRSPSEPTVIEAYGDPGPRPVVETSDGRALAMMGGGGAPPTLDHVAIVGLHFRPEDRFEGSRAGLELIRGGRSLLIEDVLVEGYGTNLVISGYDEPWSEVVLRRSIIADAWELDPKRRSQGLFAKNVERLLIEECLFLHNGWNEEVAGADPDIFRHNVYLQRDNEDVVFRGNISAYGSSHGLQQRSGGFIDDNLLLGNAIAILAQSRRTAQAGYPVYVRRNVILHGRDLTDEERRGWALDAQPTQELVVEHNLVAFQDGGMPVGIHVSAPDIAVDVLARIRGNVVYDWGGRAFSFFGERFAQAEVQGNRIYQTAPAPKPQFRVRDLPDDFTLRAEGNRASLAEGLDDDVFAEDAVSPFAPLRNDLSQNGPAPALAQAPDLGDYHASIGGEATIAAFLAEARKQRKGNWRPEYTAAAANRWLRIQYGIDAP